MFYIPHYVLILAALILNKGDRRMLALVAVIGLNNTIPFHLFTSFESYPPACAAAELITVATILFVRTRAMWICVNVCVFMFFNHMIDLMISDPLMVDPYVPVIRVLEYINIVSCCLYSQPFRDFLPRLKLAVMNGVFRVVY